MLTSIGNFLAENGGNGSVNACAGLIILLIIGILSVAFSKRQQFISAWNNTRESLIDKVNSECLKVSNLLIEIATISSEKDGVAGIKIGMISQQIIDIKDSPEFYARALKLMEGINDNIQAAKLNGDYARVRNSIEAAINLIKIIPSASALWPNDFGEIRDPVTSNSSERDNYLTDFMTLSEKASRAEKNITQAVLRIEKVLSDLRPEETLIEE